MVGDDEVLGPGRHRAQHRRGSGEKRSTPRRLLVCVNVVVAVALVGAASAAGYTEWRLSQINRVHLRSLSSPVDSTAGGAPGGGAAKSFGPSSPSPPMTVLIVGSDSRAALANTPSASVYGSPSVVGGARSDTIILARLVPATREISLLSIPRDLWVPIAGMGYQKINAALGISADLLIRTIHDQLGVDVNHYVNVDFQSFKDIADAVGGVQQYFPTRARDLYSGLRVAGPGCTLLTGDQALAFVRSRDYQYSGANGYFQQEALSDLARIQRQQVFIRSMVKKAEAIGVGDPLTLNRLIGSVTHNLTVDDSLSVSTMVALAQTFRGINSDGIIGTTLPSTAVTLPGPNDVLMPQPEADRAAVAQFLGTGATSTTSPTATPPTTSSQGSTTATLPVLGTATTNGGITPSTVAPASVAVEVDNGSGVAGQATATATALRRAGFDVVGVGSAPSYGIATTMVRYGPGQSAAAASVAARIGGGATLEEVNSLGSTVVVVTGGSLTGIVAPSPGSSTATSGYPATNTTTAPARTSTVPTTTTTTTYTLPGTPTGSTPPTCG